MSTIIFYNFACKDFDGDYGSYLKVDLSIDCNSAEHKLFSVYAFFTILVYPLGIPAMYMALLYSKRNLVNPGADRKISTEAALEEREINEEKFANLLSIGFLYSSYEPTCYYFGEFRWNERAGTPKLTVTLACEQSSLRQHGSSSSRGR